MWRMPDEEFADLPDKSFTQVLEQIADGGLLRLGSKPIKQVANQKVF